MGLLSGLSSRDVVGLVAAGAIGGLLLGVGITKLTSSSSGRSQQHDQQAKKQTRPLGRMRLYHHNTYRSCRVRWAIEELGLQKDCDILTFNPQTAPAEDKTWYRANVHPNGLIPALELASGNVMFEGAAICFYLAECQQQLLPPSDELSNYYSWSLYAVCTLEPSVKTLYVQSMMIKANNQDSKVQETATKIVKEGMEKLGQHLKDREYICGDSFSVADIIVGYTVMFASTMQGGTLLSEQPRVKDYMERLRKRPTFINSVGPRINCTHKQSQ